MKKKKKREVTLQCNETILLLWMISLALQRAYLKPIGSVFIGLNVSRLRGDFWRAESHLKYLLCPAPYSLGGFRGAEPPE